MARVPLPPPPGTIQREATLDELRKWIGNAASWMSAAYDWMGRSTGTSPLSISGNSATSTATSSLPPILNAGAPEGMQQASAGATYIDTDTNIVYLKSQGDDTTGWTALT